MDVIIIVVFEIVIIFYLKDEEIGVEKVKFLIGRKCRVWFKCDCNIWVFSKRGVGNGVC